MSVGHSATYSLPRLIDHNQIWLAGLYLSSDPCKPFWIPYLPYFQCQREKYAKFHLFPTCQQWNGSPLTRILATVNVMHSPIWLVASRSQRVSLIVVPGCLFVCLMFVCASGRCCCAAAAVLLRSSSSSSAAAQQQPAQQHCCCVAAAVLLRSSSRLLRSSSKVKAEQWVTKNPTRPTILDRIC